MTGTDPYESWGRDSELYERYTATARSLLATDSELQAAQEEWEEFFVESHGDVFSRMDDADRHESLTDSCEGTTGSRERATDPRERVFLDALYFDFLVDRLLAFAERTFGFTLANPEPHHDTDALSIDFRSLHERVLDSEPVDPSVGNSLSEADLLDADVDSLRRLYESIVSRDIRLALGEYYTPRGVAELAVEELSVADVADETFLDPGCGSGAFLAVCIDRTREALAEDCSPEEVVETVTDTVYGIDLNPVAVKSAKLGYVLSLLPSLQSAGVESVEIPVFLGDSLRLTRDDPIGVADHDLTVDHLVGNPPWITWGNLPEAVRDAWRERYADRLDLLPHRGPASRLGFGNDDVSLPFVWVCVHHYLREGGDASFVLKRDVTKGPAGKLLRSQSLDGRSLAVRFVHDFGDLRPFGEQVDAGSAIYTLSADEEPEFPIPAAAWRHGSEGEGPDFSTAGGMRRTLDRESTGFVPVDGDDPSSAWIRRDAERQALGECDHEIRHGLKDDAKEVFALDRSQLSDLEPDLVYPYLKSKHVVKYGLFDHDLHLVPMEKAGQDNEDELRTRYPRTYEYLDAHRDRLADRASSWLERGPFYNVFGLGDYTWADYKVVWCRLGFKPHFAVVSTVTDPDLGEKQVVPGDHFMFVSTDDRHEAHFLTALLNSASYQRSLRDLASEGKASLSKTVVSKLALPEYRGTSEERRLAELSMEAHEIVPEYTDVSKREYNRTTVPELEVVQAEIDEIVEEMLAEGSGFREGGRSS